MWSTAPPATKKICARSMAVSDKVFVAGQAVGQILDFHAFANRAFDFDDDKNMPVVLTCPRCNQKLRIPTDKGDLSVRCPKCRHAWEWSPTQVESPKQAEHQSHPFHIDDVEVSEECYNGYWGIGQNAFSQSKMSGMRNESERSLLKQIRQDGERISAKHVPRTTRVGRKGDLPCRSWAT
jgi:hypothetical protein